MASRLIPGEQRKRGSGNEVGGYLSKSIKGQLYYTLKKYKRSLPARTLENHSYGSWNIGLRVVQFVNCISLEGLSGSHALRTKNIRQNCLSSACKYLCSSPILYDSWTIVSRPARVERLVSSHSRVVSVRQYWTRMLVNKDKEVVINKLHILTFQITANAHHLWLLYFLLWLSRMKFFFELCRALKADSVFTSFLFLYLFLGFPRNTLWPCINLC